MTSADLMSRTSEAVQDKTCLSTTSWGFWKGALHFIWVELRASFEHVFLLKAAWKVHSFRSLHSWTLEYSYSPRPSATHSKTSKAPWFWYVLNPTFQTDSNFSCSNALFVARHGSIVVPLGTFAVPAYGALCGCGCRGLVLGFYIEPGLHHAAPDESLELDCENQCMEILPFSCVEKVSWLCSSSHGLSHGLSHCTWFPRFLDFCSWCLMLGYSMPIYANAIWCALALRNSMRTSGQAWHGPAYAGARVLCSSARRSGMVHLSGRVKACGVQPENHQIIRIMPNHT